MTLEHPSEETGTMSVHNGEDDKSNINFLGWQGVQKSEIYSRGLRNARKVEELSRTVNRFDRGEINLGQLLNEVRNL